MTNDAAVAWRIRIGDSHTWGFTSDEDDADFHGKSSGLPYVKEALVPATTVAELRAEVAENDGVIAVWRRRAESAERQVAACKSVLVRWNTVIKFAEEIGYTPEETEVMTYMAQELAIAGAEAALTKESP